MKDRVDAAKVQRSVSPIIPNYMVMGDRGMAEMGRHMMHMPMPENSIPMIGGKGSYGEIDMGGMLTILKVRDNLTSYEDPGWYQPPPGTLAQVASKQELKRDGIKI
jgi:hypothetical protein